MTITISLPLLLGGAVAAAVALAPAAGAMTNDDCPGPGSPAVCWHEAGHTSLADPTADDGGYWPFTPQSGDLPSPDWVLE